MASHRLPEAVTDGLTTLQAQSGLSTSEIGILTILATFLAPLLMALINRKRDSISMTSTVIASLESLDSLTGRIDPGIVSRITAKYLQILARQHADVTRTESYRVATTGWVDALRTRRPGFVTRKLFFWHRPLSAIVSLAHVYGFICSLSGTVLLLSGPIGYLATGEAMTAILPVTSLVYFGISFLLSRFLGWHARRYFGPATA